MKRISLKGRIISLIFFIIGFFIFYGVYLFSLQIVNVYEYRKRATEVARRVIPIPAQRGEIFDRNYDVPMALNIDSFAVAVIPGELDGNKLEEVLNRLSELFGVSKEELGKKIPEKYSHIYTPIEIKSGVSFSNITYIAEHIQDFPGVTWHSKPIRSYLETGSISHVMGYVGDITREELQVLYNKGYESGSVIGKSGVEKQYDMLLRGEKGWRYRIVDVIGRKIEDSFQEEIPPVPGNNLVLTIDRNIQRLCEEALGNRSGSIIVLKPSTGEILALVSYPWYNPNIFYARNGDEEFRKLSLDPGYPFLNRAIQSSYSPASMFKIILTTAVIEEEAFPLEKTVTCTGKLEFGDRTFKCWKETGHGPVNIYEGLAQSCNIFFFTMGTKYLGIERIVDYSRRFGLGEITGIDLPGEVSGLVPSPQWKEKVYNAKWRGGDTMNISIGQGYLTVTPIQVANLVSMIVNEGVIYRPHVLKEVRDPISGNVIREIEPEVLHSSAIRKSTFEKVQRAMRGVITDGTARVVITTDAVEIAGKTGTGQVSLADGWTSWFTAYAPYKTDNPEERVVVVVMVEAANEWEWWAPKAANIIFQGIFSNQTYKEAVEALNIWYVRDSD
ncbi:MAG: penicillin-binding protein 2 [Spirochaetes bacterium]|nr:MAG: penicillin-binding protein 2 [Spirochaetota bacterium]